jgi:hypothetical protein
MLVGIIGYFLKNNNEEIVPIEHLLNCCYIVIVGFLSNIPYIRDLP